MDKTESEKQEWNLETRNQNGSAFYPWLPDLFSSFASYVSRFLDSFLSAFFRNTSTGSETRSIPNSLAVTDRNRIRDQKSQEL